jgi:DNA-binding transcriptional ArsR family regulator
MTIDHPDAEQIDLADVLTALGDGTRLAMIGLLDGCGERELMCSQFLGLGSKTVLSYHLAKLREAGVVKVRPEGTKRLISLRREDLNQRFPGFLDAILTNAVPLATRPQPPAEASALPVAD